VTATGAAGPDGCRSVEERLYEEGFGFRFFQAVRLLERLGAGRRPVGRAGPPDAEAVRFRTWASLAFPASEIYEVVPAAAECPVPVMTVTFMGLYGLNGPLPRHYTELLLRLERESKEPEKQALRAWFDLFNHRLISLFYRAWEKYRFHIPYERGEHAGAEPDAFTRCLLSLTGLGVPALRNRLRVTVRDGPVEAARPRTLAQVEDLAVLYYSGYFAHRPRCAAALQALLGDFFDVGVAVRQFQGQWLALDSSSQSRLGSAGTLGVDAIAGDRVWDVQGKFRVRLGPLRYPRFHGFLPDRAPVAPRKAFFLLSHLLRLYVGPELDYDVQLVLKAEDVPACRLVADAGPRLGWDTWICSRPLDRDADDPVFAGDEAVLL
jgi:type VI secretion system protein ImpH